MKYRVTEKHPDLKKDVHIKKTKKGYYIGIDDANFLITDDMTAEWLDDKWIEEIHEPEFTKDDMINFKCMTGLNSPSDAEILLNAYIKSKNEK